MSEFTEFGESFVKLLLCEIYLPKSSESCLAKRVDLEGFEAVLLSCSAILFPLEERKTLVDKWQHVHRRWPRISSQR